MKHHIIYSKQEGCIIIPIQKWVFSLHTWHIHVIRVLLLIPILGVTALTLILIFGALLDLQRVLCYDKNINIRLETFSITNYWPGHFFYSCYKFIVYLKIDTTETSFVALSYHKLKRKEVDRWHERRVHLPTLEILSYMYIHFLWSFLYYMPTALSQ